MMIGQKGCRAEEDDLLDPPFYLRHNRAGLGLLCDVLVVLVVVVVVVIFLIFFIIFKATSYKKPYKNKAVDPSEKGYCAKFEPDMTSTFTI